MRVLGTLVALQVALVAGVVWVVFGPFEPIAEFDGAPVAAEREEREGALVVVGDAPPERVTDAPRREDAPPDAPDASDGGGEPLALDASAVGTRLESTLVVLELADAEGRTLREIRGVVVHPDGVVLSRFAPLLGAYSGRCRLGQDSSERAVIAGVIRQDPIADLALVRLDLGDFADRGARAALPLLVDPPSEVFAGGDPVFVSTGHRARAAVVEFAEFTTLDGRFGCLLAAEPRVVPETFLVVSPVESAVVGLCRPIVANRTLDGGTESIGDRGYRIFVDPAFAFADALELPIATTLEANTVRFFADTFADLESRARNEFRLEKWSEAAELFAHALERGAAERVEATRLGEIERLLREAYLAEIARLRAAKRLEEAAGATGVALATFAGDAVLWFTLAEIRTEQGLVRLAIDALLETRALEGGGRIDPLLENGYRSLAGEAIAAADGRSAEHAYLEGIERLPRSGVLRLELASLYQSWEAYRDAISLLEAAKSLDPTLRERADFLLEKIDDVLSRREAVIIPIPEGASTIRANVVVDGRAESRFVVDTGATYTSISEALARELGYDLERGETTDVNTAAGPQRVRVVKLASVSLEGYSVRDLDAFILPSRAGDGINLLGLNFLSRFKFSVDSQRREFRLERP